MALDRFFLDLHVRDHRFLFFSCVFFSVLVIPRQSWPALWSTFGRTIK